MSNMTENETYQGWANRETWAFNLHWSNDQGLYNETLERAREAESTRPSDDPLSDYQVGEYVVAYWKDLISEYPAFRDEVGSWWRIDYAEVGAAVRESLDNES